jgi:hypothetical protein
MILDGFNMNTMSNRIMITGALYLVIFAFGFLLTRSGSPYSTTLLTVHKLASLAAIIVLYQTFAAVNKATGLNTLTIAFGLITGLTFVAIIATGGIISIGGQIPELIYKVHRFLPVLNVVSAAAALYLLNNVR